METGWLHKLRYGLNDRGVRIPAGVRGVFLFSKTFRSTRGPHPVSLFERYWGSFQGLQGPRLYVDHSHPSLRLRMSGAVLLLPLYAFMAWTRTPVPVGGLWYQQRWNLSSCRRSKLGVWSGSVALAGNYLFFYRDFNWLSVWKLVITYRRKLQTKSVVCSR